MSVTPVNVQIPSDAEAPVIADFVEHAIRVAYINRNHLRALSSDSWAQPGVDVLFTSDGSGQVYVGQARNLKQRLGNHHSKPKLPRTRAVAFKRDTTSGFNTAEIGYLEGRLSAEIGALRDYHVIQGQQSGDETLPKHTMISLDVFVKSMLLAQRLTGIDITRTREEDPSNDSDRPDPKQKSRVLLADLVSSGLLQAGDILYIQQGDVKAAGTVTADGEVIVQGVSHTTPSVAAAAALQLQSSNGWTAWRLGEYGGKPLDTLRQKWLQQQKALHPHKTEIKP